ncbi:MAG: aminomethyl transferase family protein [Chromatiales bacterium]|jgi:aminomethyltransferase|nr:aminomethyl transferase family protein [Chromatiales bacterium]
MTAELSRTSALASRHTHLGSGLEDWNGMGTAWSYDSDPNAEHDAVREAAGLFDMSPLKKVFVRGLDAARVVNHIITRDMSLVGPGMSAYGAILSEARTVRDDAIIANNGNDEWMHCHGSGGSMDLLRESAAGLNVDIELNDDLHNISLQGPKALELLQAHTWLDVASLRYFQHAATELFGHSCRISRTGYSGERGYEIFCDASVVGDMWDQVLGNGDNMGVMPCSFASLDKIRIDAALLFYGYDMTDEHTPWEVGLGFTLNPNSECRCKAAALASQGKERFVAAGIAIDHDDALVGGEVLRRNGQDVGVLNSPVYSHRLGKSLALVHLDKEAAAPGTSLEVSSDEFSGTATVEAIPFFNPSKSRTHV